MDDLQRRLDALQRDEQALKRRRLLESLRVGGAGGWGQLSDGGAALSAVSHNDLSAALINTQRFPASFNVPSAGFGGSHVLSSAENSMMRNLLSQGFSSQAAYLPTASFANSESLVLDRVLAQSRALAAEDRIPGTWNEIARTRQEEAIQDATRFFQTQRNLGGASSSASLQHIPSQPSASALFAQGSSSTHGPFQGLVASRIPPGTNQSASIRPDPSGLSRARPRWEDDAAGIEFLATQRIVEVLSPSDVHAASRKKEVPPAKLQCTPNPKALAVAKRDFTPLGIEEDINWLSEMHCFLRAEIVEIFRVQNSKLTGRSTSKGLSVNQVGIRCRWCADLPPESRVSRSSAFPSSLRQLYQSFTMMVRDHFGPHTMCTAIPASYRTHLNHLRNTRNSQGASDSKHYWAHAAHKIGMVDTDEGIQITEESKAEGKKIGNFGAPSAEEATHEALKKPPPATLLMKPDDLSRTNMFFYTLLLQTQVVYLQKSELVAKRRTLPQGLEGIGCRHCCAAGRYGFSRRFPLRRRSLPEEVMDIYSHMRRCTLCPNAVKERLEKLHAEYEAEKVTLASGNKDGRAKDPHKDFFDILWRRLGRTQDIKT